MNNAERRALRRNVGLAVDTGTVFAVVVTTVTAGALLLLLRRRRAGRSPFAEPETFGPVSVEPFTSSPSDR